MQERKVVHATFAIERNYKAAPARVFAAWAEPDTKARWFACHEEWQPHEYRLDFRVGGSEHVETGPTGGPTHTYDAFYQDIVSNERIVYSYDMRLAGVVISVSLATLELIPKGEGTHVIFTEQAAYLDGRATPEDREKGTRLGFVNLDALFKA